MNAPTSPTRPPTSSALHLDFAGRQYIGKRERQEDYYAFSVWRSEGRDKLVLALGDGLGAHAGGNLASFFLIQQFLKALKLRQEETPEALRESLLLANAKLGVLSMRFNEQNPPMGSTLISFVIDQHHLNWISVGDSLLYLYREGELLRLNEDHSLTPLLEQRVRAGTLSAEEAAVHPDRHVLQSACLGVDIYLIDNPKHAIELQPRDIVIGASDGIMALTDPQIANIVEQYAPAGAASICEALIKAIQTLDLPRQDNVTLGVYQHGVTRQEDGAFVPIV